MTKVAEQIKNGPLTKKTMHRNITVCNIFYLSERA